MARRTTDRQLASAQELENAAPPARHLAEIRIFLVSREDLGLGILKLRRGWLGEVSIRDGMYLAELRGITQKLQMTVARSTRPTAPPTSAMPATGRCRRAGGERHS